MEVDTGASLSIISEQTFREIASPTDKLQSTSITLTTYSCDNLHIMETYDVQVGYKSVTDTSISSSTRPWTKFIWEKLVRKDQDRMELYLLTSGTVIISSH